MSKPVEVRTAVDSFEGLKQVAPMLLFQTQRVRTAVDSFEGLKLTGVLVGVTGVLVRTAVDSFEGLKQNCTTIRVAKRTGQNGS